MSRSLTNAEVNHLRRLVAWVRCDVGQSPDELMDTVRRIKPAIDEPPSDFQKAALMRMHAEAEAAPKYIRAAIKALEKTIREAEGEVVDADAEKNRLTAEPLRIGRDNG